MKTQTTDNAMINVRVGLHVGTCRLFMAKTNFLEQKAIVLIARYKNNMSEQNVFQNDCKNFLPIGLLLG